MPFRMYVSLICLMVSATVESAAKSGSTPHSTQAQSTNAASGRLDQKGIHFTYREGDFETVIARIDSFTQANPTYDKSDSIFIAKHFAVIYTANPATREKGKNYMFRLLNLVPSAKIIDMFVSDEIDRIFEKVREEYVVRQLLIGNNSPNQLQSSQYAANKMIPGSGDPVTESPASTGKPIPGASRKVYWVAGTAVAFAAAGSLFYFMNQPQSKGKTYEVPH